MDRRTLRRTFLTIALLAVPLATRAEAFVAPNDTAGMALQPGPGGFVSLSPIRLLDSRQSAQGPLAANETRLVTVTGVGAGSPPRDAGAVALNITVINPNAGFLSVWPADEPEPDTSALNFDQNQTVANAVTVRVSPSGQIAVRASATVHIIVDVLGWYAAPATQADAFGTSSAIPTPGGGFFGLHPVRLLDTRVGGKLSGNEPRALTVTPGIDLAGTHVAAVVLNVTAVDADGDGFASVVGWGDDPLAVSTVNFTAHHGAVANQVTARVGADNTVILYASVSTHLLIDLMGFYTQGPLVPGGFTPVPSQRLMDTRPSGFRGNAYFDVQTDNWDLGVAGTAGVPTAAAAVVLNLTGLAPSRAGHFSVWPDGQSRPPTSTLNVARAAVRANAVTVGLGSNDGVHIFTDTDAAFLVDVSGWFRSPFVAL